MALSNCYFDFAALETWKASVEVYTDIIAKEIYKITGQTCLAVHTGSIVEQFGVPLFFKDNNGISLDLRTDHDVMFVFSGLFVNNDANASISMKKVTDSTEFFHIIPKNQGNMLIESIQDLDKKHHTLKLDTVKAKKLLLKIVSSLEIQNQFHNASGFHPRCKSIFSLSMVPFTRRFLS